MVPFATQGSLERVAVCPLCELAKTLISLLIKLCLIWWIALIMSLYKSSSKLCECCGQIWIKKKEEFTYPFRQTATPTSLLFQELVKKEYIYHWRSKFQLMMCGKPVTNGDGTCTLLHQQFTFHCSPTDSWTSSGCSRALQIRLSYLCLSKINYNYITSAFNRQLKYIWYYEIYHHI